MPHPMKLEFDPARGGFLIDLVERHSEAWSQALSAHRTALLERIHIGMCPLQPDRIREIGSFCGRGGLPIPTLVASRDDFEQRRPTYPCGEQPVALDIPHARLPWLQVVQGPSFLELWFDPTRRAPQPAWFCHRDKDLGVEFWWTWKRFPEAMAFPMHQRGSMLTTLVGIRVPTSRLPSADPYDHLVFEPADFK